MGDMEQSIIAQTLPHEQLPDVILNRPKVPDHLLFYYDAFWELDSERQLGMAAGPIPWSAIMLYADAYVLDSYMSELLLFFIRAMDRTYLKYQADQRKNKD
jgi:hypothetical protein